MQVEKVINNNVVSTYDSKGNEVIIMGKGIGFQAKSGSEIEEDRIEKIFYLESKSAFDKFRNLIQDMPLEHIQVSSDIIVYAGEVLKNKLSPNIYITLTDHISFAIERFSQGMLFSNPLLWDVQSLYRQEYLIGEYAVALIEKRIGIKLPEDEAASIALHIVNAEFNTAMSETMNITKILPKILDRVKEEFNIKVDMQSINHERFVTHLKFLAQRIVKGQQYNDVDVEFCEMVKELYKREYKCSEEIAECLKENFNDTISGDEMAMLTINIRRFISRHKVKKLGG
jgi:beta-glucoside operon transcriptional antiterminator